MRTRNSNFPNNSNITIPRRRNKGRAPNIVEPELRTIVAPMAERIMEELLRAPTEGYREAIVLPKINADHFEIKTNLLQLVQANPFHGLENENPHAHINSFKRITSTLRFRNVPSDVIKLMMFSYSLEGAAKTKMLELLRLAPVEPELLGDASQKASRKAWRSRQKKLSLLELTPTRMTLELADRSITYPKGLAEDVFVKVGKFHFPTDFVVVDFEADPRVPLILGRSFLRTGRALIDVYGEEITLQVDNEAVTFNLDQITRYSSTNDKLVNRIDIIDAVCEEYAPEFLGFYNPSGGNPTTTSEPFTSEFILEEILRMIQFQRKLIMPIAIRRKIFV
ncbi:reverse transcriptase domain-containing protein [Tanacetum coccineum]|uniref:Reverse transcriptase domain-containing protein n=1 Tax=Tanacetum coccineum TaxID=301880 RepID=A0ABQ4YN39_9ASTR